MTEPGQIHQFLRGWELIERHGGGYRITDVLRRWLDEHGGLGAIYGLFRSDPWSSRDWSNGVVPEARAEVSALVQDAVRASSGIGVLLVAEAPHGDMSLSSTLLPTNLAQAATWSPDLVEEAYAALGERLRADGQHLALVSGLDVLRDPRWGRSEETFGESPLLAARMVDAQVRGLQGGAELDSTSHVGAVVKHLAAQGAADGGRNASSAVIGAVELAETHLPPVVAAVRAGAVGMMAAYNDIDGAPCVANRWLLTEWLRDELGFEGVVMADALAVDRLAESLGPARAAMAALGAGVDLNLGDASWLSLDETSDAAMIATQRVLALKARFALLADQQESIPAPPAPERLDAASAAIARSCITVIGAAPTPLAERDAPLVLGTFARSPESLLGDYVPPVRGVASLAEAVAERWPGAPSFSCDDRAVETVTHDDVVIVQLGGTSERAWEQEFAATGATLGETARATCGEGVDLASIDLPHDQNELLARLRARNPRRLIGVAVMGRPHVLTRAAELCDDLLVAWYPGPHGARAITEVLAGDRPAIGHLPVSLLADAGALGWHDDDRVGDVEPSWLDAPAPVLARLGDGVTASGRVVWTRQPTSTLCTIHLEAAGFDRLVLLFGRRLGGKRWPRRRIALDFVRVPAHATTATLQVSDEDAFEGPTGDAATRCVLSVEPLGETYEITRQSSPLGEDRQGT